MSTHIVIFHHEHAYNNEPTSEQVYGPMTEDEAKATIAQIQADLNKDRDPATGLWHLSPCGTYTGMGEDDQRRLGYPNIATEVWANAQPIFRTYNATSG